MEHIQWNMNTFIMNNDAKEGITSNVYLKS